MQAESEVARNYGQLLRLTQRGGELTRRRGLVTALRQAGAMLPNDSVGDIISSYRNKLTTRGAVVIGSTAFAAYSNALGLTDVPKSMTATNDVDVAFQRAAAVVGPPQTAANSESRHKSIREASMDFVTPRLPGEPESGEGVQHFAWVPRLKSYAHILPADRSLLITKPMDAVIVHDAGVLVQMPDPVRYALHKLAIGPSRSNAGKKQKDREQATLLLEHAARGHPAKLQALLSEFVAYGNGALARPLLEGLESCQSGDPVFQAWRQDAIQHTLKPALRR